MLTPKLSLLCACPHTIVHKIGMELLSQREPRGALWAPPQHASLQDVRAQRLLSAVTTVCAFHLDQLMAQVSTGTEIDTRPSLSLDARTNIKQQQQ